MSFKMCVERDCWQLDFGTQISFEGHRPVLVIYSVTSGRISANLSPPTSTFTYLASGIHPDFISRDRRSAFHRVPTPIPEA
jgi:hypothetical protein